MNKQENRAHAAALRSALAQHGPLYVRSVKLHPGHPVTYQIGHRDPAFLQDQRLEAYVEKVLPRDGWTDPKAMSLFCAYLEKCGYIVVGQSRGVPTAPLCLLQSLEDALKAEADTH